MAKELCRSNQHVQNMSLQADIGRSAHPSGSTGLQMHNTFFSRMKTKLELCCSQNRHQQHYHCCYLLEGALSSCVQGLQRLPKAKQWKPEALQQAVPWPVASQLSRNSGVRRRTSLSILPAEYTAHFSSVFPPPENDTAVVTSETKAVACSYFQIW